MKFTSFSKLALAISAISSVDCSPIVKRDNQCFASTFAPEFRNDSPWVSDCQQLARNIAGNGSWKVNQYDGWKQLAQYNTCAFSGLSPTGELGGWIGNEDIRDLIRDSINFFASPDGKIGAHGEMECQAAFATLEWSIHRNNLGHN